MAEPARVTAVVVNWNSGDDLDGCLASLAGQGVPPERVVVVDNASSDGSAERARPRFPGCEFLMLSENRGFAGGANAGIARREGGAVLVLNPDAWLRADFLERALPHLDRPEVGFVAGKVLRADGLHIDTAGQYVSGVLRRVKERGYGERDTGKYDAPGPVESVCGAVALYAASLLDRLAPEGKLFDEEFFAFWEDADVGARARRAGLVGWYEPSAVAWHRRGGTRRRSGRILGRTLQLLGRDEAVQYHILKNRYLYLAKNEPVWSLVVRLPVFAVVDGAVLAAVGVLRPRLFARLVRTLPGLVGRAWGKRGGVG